MQKGSGSKVGTAATDVWLNSGPGQRLDGGETPTYYDGGGGAAGVDAASSLANEDAQLAMAISASMQDGGLGGGVGIVGARETKAGHEVAGVVAMSSVSKGSGEFDFCRMTNGEGRGMGGGHEKISEGWLAWRLRNICFRRGHCLVQTLARGGTLLVIVIV